MVKAKFQLASFISKILLIVLCVGMIVSCKKEELTIADLYGDWELTSVKIDGEEYLDLFEMYNYGSILTDCDTPVKYQEYRKLVSAVLHISGSSYQYHTISIFQKIDYDSTYQTCVPQYYSETNSSIPSGSIFIPDLGSFNITFMSGSFIFTKIYIIEEFTKNKLTVTGYAPDFPPGLTSGVGTYIFTR